MNVSSATSNWWQYLQRLQNNSTADQSTTTQTTATTSETKSRYEGQDSETAAAFFSGLMSQGLVPVSGSTSSDTAESSSDNTSKLEAVLSSFLDKVKNGTVTEDDLTALQSALNESDDATTLAAAPPPPPPPPMQVAASAYDTNQSYSVASRDSTTAAQSV